MNETIASMARTGIAISLVDLLLGLCLAVLLGLVIVATYRVSHRGFHYERSFLLTLVMTPPIVAVVMMLIGSNLALSLGMVGALSIIRFRTVIKDSRDMIYLFFAIAVGLGCGTYNWIVITITSIFLSTAMLVLHFVHFGKPMQADYVLVLAGSGARPDDKFIGLVKKHVDFLEVRSVNVEDEEWEIVFEIRFFKERPLFSESSLLDDLKKTHEVKRISFLAPQLSLPV